MADVADIRQALADSLVSLVTGNVLAQVSPYILSNPTPPCAYVTPGPVEYDKTMHRGHDDWTFLVYALVGFTSDIGSQEIIDTLLDTSAATSVKTLLEADRKLGGLVQNVWVSACSGVRVYPVDGSLAPMVGAEWTVNIMA